MVKAYGAGSRGAGKIRKKVAQRRKEEAHLAQIFADNADPHLQSSAKVYMEQDSLLSKLAEVAISATSLLDTALYATKKASEKETIDAIARAYAYWILSGSSDRFNSLARRVYATNRKRKNKRTTKLHLFVEAMISHGESESRANSQLCNRDVQAIRWLNHNKVDPAKVQELFRQKGEGLDAWSRRWAEVSGAKRQQASQEDICKESTTSQSSEKVAPLPPSPTAPRETIPIPHDEVGSTVYQQPQLEPDFVITWQDNLLGELSTFHLKNVSKKILSDLKEIKLALRLYSEVYAT